MYEHVMVETLSGTFNAISGGGNHSVQNSPWGGGVSIASSRPNMSFNVIRENARDSH